MTYISLVMMKLLKEHVPNKGLLVGDIRFAYAHYPIGVAYILIVMMPHTCQMVALGTVVWSVDKWVIFLGINDDLYWIKDGPLTRRGYKQHLVRENAGVIYPSVHAVYRLLVALF